MKSKWYLIASVIQLVIGALAILFFIVLATDGENMTKWIVTLILVIVYIKTALFKRAVLCFNLSMLFLNLNILQIIPKQYMVTLKGMRVWKCAKILQLWQ